jgi:ribA/ribD-fused uncharacterized protein
MIAILRCQQRIAFMNQLNALSNRVEYYGGEVKLDIMRRADRAKYEQNPELAAMLLATGNAEIVEDAPNDLFWGTGPDGTGANWAGRVLMEVRESLRAATKPP